MAEHCHLFNFLPSDEDRRLLDELSRRHGVTRATVLRRLLHAAHEDVDPLMVDLMESENG